MLKTDFDRHFKILEGALRGSRWNDGPLTAEVRKSRHEAFWQAFRNVRGDDWEQVVADAIEQFNEFPHIPDLKGMIRQYEAARRWKPTPEVRFGPNDHGCGLKATTDKLTYSRRFLAAAGPQGNYEALHIMCQGDQMRARCPMCGKSCPVPFTIPLAEYLMRTEPSETNGWNPLAKGLWPCKECGGRDE